MCRGLKMTARWICIPVNKDVGPLFVMSQGSYKNFSIAISTQGSLLSTPLLRPMVYQWLTRDHFVYAPSQWETTSQWNISSHWLGAYTKWSLLLQDCGNSSALVVELPQSCTVTLKYEYIGTRNSHICFYISFPFDSSVGHYHKWIDPITEEKQMVDIYYSICSSFVTSIVMSTFSRNSPFHCIVLFWFHIHGIYQSYLICVSSFHREENTNIQLGYLI